MAATLSATRQFTEQAKMANSLRVRAVRAITSTTGLTSSGLILLGVSILAWILGRFIAGRPMFLLAYGGLFVLGLSWGIGRRPLPLVGERANARSRRREGETISMEVTLTAERKI